MRAIRDSKSWLRLLSVAAGSAVIAALGCTASAQSGGGSQPGADYTFHWAVKTGASAKRQLGDLQARVNLENTPFERDIVKLYMSQCGIFPDHGPQEVEMDPTWMPRHLRKLERQLNSLCPDRNFSGLIVVDYERWDLLWDRTRNEAERLSRGTTANMDYQDDWRVYIRTHRPELLRGLSSEQQEEVFRTTYEESAKNFYSATLSRIKELRPNAKAAFCRYPSKIYRAPNETAPGVIGYGDGQYQASRLNDRLQWLWDLQDVIVPTIYCRYRSVPNPLEEYENTPEEDHEYVRSNIAEALRVANGKPVIANTCYFYQRDQGHPLYREKLNDVNLTNQLRTPGEAGAAGVILWGGLQTVEELRELQDYCQQAITPVANAADAALNAGSHGPGGSGSPGAPGAGENPQPPQAGPAGGGEQAAKPQPKADRPRGSGGFTRDEAREAMRRYRETVKQKQPQG